MQEVLPTYEIGIVQPTLETEIVERPLVETFSKTKELQPCRLSFYAVGQISVKKPYTSRRLLPFQKHSVQYVCYFHEPRMV